MNKKDVLIEQLAVSSLNLVCDQGLDNFSIRNVAEAANCSVTPVTKRFKTKADLLHAAQSEAYGADLQFHEAFAEQVDGMPFSFENLTEMVVSYVEQRAQFRVARFWSELLVKSSLGLSSKDVLAHWYRMRVNFWQNQLQAEKRKLHQWLAEFIAIYTMMEEFYAYELYPSIHYRFLLKEGVRSMLAKSFGIENRDSVSGAICFWLNKGQVALSEFDRQDTSDLAEKLLDLASEEIRKKGVGSLSQRTLAKKAGASSAMIGYHFGNMANFTNQAIWHVLMREIPASLDPKENPQVKQKNNAEWLHALKRLISIESEAGRAGFYTQYARTTGQACLLSARQHALHPLIEHLRRIDGWGTYRSGKSVWPETMAVARGTAMAFGVWIKGLAIIHEALGENFVLEDDRLLGAAELLF